MARTYNVIDADGHVLEPVDIWDSTSIPVSRAAPADLIDTDGKERLLVEGRVVGSPRASASSGPSAPARGARPPKHDEVRRRAPRRVRSARPHPRHGPRRHRRRVPLSERRPLRGRLRIRSSPPAMCRAYNRWLADYCKPYPDRLFGVAMLPMQSSTSPSRRCATRAKKLGMRGDFLHPSPTNGTLLHRPGLPALRAEAQELDVSIGIDEGACGSCRRSSLTSSRAAGRSTSSPHHGDDARRNSMIWSGILDRFPSLRDRFIESGGGWIAPWLDRMDRHFDDQGFNDSGLKRRPTELFRRNAGFRLSRSRAASRWPTTSARTRSCGRPTTRTPTASSPARRSFIETGPQLSDATKREILGGGAPALLRSGLAAAECCLSRRLVDGSSKRSRWANRCPGSASKMCRTRPATVEAAASVRMPSERYGRRIDRSSCSTTSQKTSPDNQPAVG